MIKFLTKQLSLEVAFDTSHNIGDFLEWLKNKDIVGVDTETTGSWNGKNQILSLQVGDVEIQWVIDWQTLSREEKDTILSALSVEEITKILQNAKFDLKFFFQEGHYFQTIFDVMVAEATIHAGKEMEKGSYALDTLAKKYAGMQLDKSIRGVIHREGMSTRVVEYAAKDVECLLPIMKAQHKQLIELKMANENHQDEQTVLGVENRACLCLALMEFNGMKLDLEKWNKLTEELAAELVELEKQLDEIVFNDNLFEGIGKRQMDLFGGNSTGINWKSPQQKLQLLQRINPQIENTSERAVAKHKHEHVLIPTMQTYIRKSKLYNGFGKAMPKMINKHTGRIHTSFWQNLSTGRISSSEPNMQNIPSRTEEGKIMRSCFIAQPGYKIVGGDLSGAELRLLAEISQDETWLDVFKNDGDLHSILCAKTFKIPIEDVNKPSPFKDGVSYRNIQKTLDFMIPYGGGAYKLADILQMPVDVAQKIIDDFLASVPKVGAYLDMITSYSINSQKSITLPPYRRIRWLPWKDSWESNAVGRAGRNHSIQGSNADWIKCALGRVYYYVIQNNLQQIIKPILQVYDEIQTECKADYDTRWRAKLEEIMVTSGQIIIKTIPVKADCSISTYWTK